MGTPDDPNTPQPGAEKTGEPAASTAAVEDHTDVDQFRGEDADPPEDIGSQSAEDELAASYADGETGDVEGGDA